jgi:alkylhydroperoxidase family enzyme
MTERPTFLDEPPASTDAERLYADDIESDGYVGNVSRLWCWRPDVYEGMAKLRGMVTEDSTLTDQEIAVLVTATASALRDSYCSFAWGSRLARLAGDETAAGVIASDDGGLDERGRALAAWARQVVRDPNATTPGDVERLRAAGLSDREIFEATAYVGLRLAFSSVNDALGANPDVELAKEAPARVRAAIDFGRSPA